jgi:hypothetical protein
MLAARGSGVETAIRSVDSLGLLDDPERNGAAILLAVLAGYLTAGGEPPHSVALTEGGRAVLKSRGL